MEFFLIQQQISMQKTKLLNLINNLINTQLINQEIFINNEIKKECENLNSLLIGKQNNLMNQMKINNNININPLMFQQNVIMNIPQMDMNPIQNPIFQNNLNEIENTNDKNDIIINVSFIHVSGKHTLIWCKPNEKMSKIIKNIDKKKMIMMRMMYFFIMQKK